LGIDRIDRNDANGVPLRSARLTLPLDAPGEKISDVPKRPPNRPAAFLNRWIIGCLPGVDTEIENEQRSLTVLTDAVVAPLETGTIVRAKARQRLTRLQSFQNGRE